GLVLFAFAASHLFNHALGLVSLESMQAMQTWRIGYTRSAAGTLILAAALVVHIGLGLARLASRTTLRMPTWEAFQIASGLLIPVLLFKHIAMTRLADTLYGWNDSYLFALAELWPAWAWWQTSLIVLVWSHACVGLHHWLRLSRWYRRLAPLLLALAVLLPAAALAGFAVAGRQVAQSLSSPADLAALRRAGNWPAPDQLAQLDSIEAAALSVLGALLALVAGLLAVRRIARGRTPQVEIQYTGGPRVRGPVGATLLEISRLRRVPHASVCGGRARCSTCRVRIDLGIDQLALPRFAEAVTLGSINAPPGVRLACQTRASVPLTITRLVQPSALASIRAPHAAGDAAGVERKLAILFLDVRGFTRWSQDRLPYDIVFLLNQFFAAIGAAIEAEGGWIDKYLGDGLLAVFGRETGAREGCRQALRAARAIDTALDSLNRRLEAELGEPLAVGVGIHAGPLVLGRIGHGQSAALTVIGRTVNAAARLESLTRDKHCQLIVSRDAARIAGWAAEGFSAERIGVRGLSAPIEVIIVPRGRDLPASFAAPTETVSQSVSGAAPA
ncbi:MAG TPA: adenylate/guanylate cyclase domain-containing protein, partial [Candidatus Limnocylindrales bacterium]